MFAWQVGFAALCGLCGCGRVGFSFVDAGEAARSDAARADAGPQDAGRDGGRADAGARDGGPSVADAGAVDAGAVDAGGSVPMEAAFESASHIGGDGIDNCFSFAMAPDGHHAIAGGVGSTADLGDGVNTMGVGGHFVSTFDEAGQLDWAVRSGGSSTDRANGVSYLPDGTLVVVGEFRPALDLGLGVLPSQGSADGYVVTYDPVGNALADGAGGSSGGDLFHAPAPAVGPGWVVAGTMRGASTFDSVPIAGEGGTDGVVVRYSDVGDVLWAVGLGASGPDEARAVATATDGYYIGGELAGTSTLPGVPPAADNDGYVARLDTSGNVEWALSLQGAGNSRIYGLATGADDEVYAVGEHAGDVIVGGRRVAAGPGTQGIVARIGATGDVAWVQSAGGSGGDFLHGVTHAGGAVYVTGGGSGDFLWEGRAVAGTGAIVARLSPLGELHWTHRIPGMSALGVGAAGGLVAVGGGFSGTVEPVPGMTLTSRGSRDCVIVRLRE